MKNFLTDEEMGVLEAGQESPGFISDERMAMRERIAAEQPAYDAEAAKSISGRFARALPGAFADVAIKNPLKFGASAVASVADIPRQLTGKKPIDTKLPFIGKTFQAEHQDRVSGLLDKAEQGTLGKFEQLKVLQPFGEVPLAGIEAATLPGLAKSVKTGVTKTASSVSNLFAGRSARKSLEAALEITAPVINKKAAITAISPTRAGQPGGVTSGRFGTTKYVPSKYDIEVAETTAPFVKKSNNFAQNSESIGNEIKRVSETEIIPFLRANPRAVNVATVEAHFNKIETPDLFKTDPILQKTYELVKQRMLNHVRASGGTMENLWDARKGFDDDVIREFGEVAFTDPKGVPIRRAVNDMRKALNEFIAEQIGDKQFTQYMRKLSNLYEGGTRIAEKNFRLLESSRFKRFKVNNPNKWATIKWGGGLLGGGFIGSQILD